MSTKTIVYAAMIAAAYTVLTIALAPLSYGPLQLRVSGMLVPLALVNPVYGLGLAIGTGLSNLTSPFGAWDFVAMPIAMFGITQAAYRLRRVPWVTLPGMAIVASCAIAYFPLHLGGGLQFWPVVAWIFVSLIILYIPGYLILRRTVLWTP